MRNSILGLGGRQSHVGTYSTCLTYPQEVNLELVAVKSDSVTKETFASTDITILSIRLIFVRNYLLCKLFVFKLRGIHKLRCW